VAWANTIREGAFKALDCLKPFTANEQAREMVESWRTRMTSENSAKWWIDNRSDMPKPFVSTNDGKTDMYAARLIVTEFRNLFK